MKPNLHALLYQLHRLASHRLLAVALVLVLCNTASAEETNIVANLAKNPEAAKKLGLQKPTPEEKEEWNGLLTAVYFAGEASGRTNRTPLAVSDVDIIGGGQKKSTSRLWLSKADLDGDDVVKLENGAVFKVSAGYVGVGIRRQVALIEDGSRWSLWISRKRMHRGELLRAPETGKPVAFLKAAISSVASDGSVITMLDGSVYEVDELGRIDTSLWLPASDVFVLEDGRIFNASDGGELIDCRRLK